MQFTDHLFEFVDLSLHGGNATVHGTHIEEGLSVGRRIKPGGVAQPRRIVNLDLGEAECFEDRRRFRCAHTALVDDYL